MKSFWRAYLMVVAVFVFMGSTMALGIGVMIAALQVHWACGVLFLLVPAWLVGGMKLIDKMGNV